MWLSPSVCIIAIFKGVCLVSPNYGKNVHDDLFSRALSYTVQPANGVIQHGEAGQVLYHRHT